mgnify:CR=1 FL=1
MIIDLSPTSEEEMEKREKNVERIVSEFKKTSMGAITAINSTTMVEEGGINPYLAVALDMTTIKEIIEFFFNRKVERSLGTSFGTVLEKFIMNIFDGISGKEMDPMCRKRGKKPKICWWDVAIKRPFLENGNKYKGLLMAVKSGPATMNADTVNTFVDKAKVAEENGYRPFLIFAYGKEASGVIKGTLAKKGFPAEKYVRVGKEIFEEFFDNSDYYKRSLDLFRVGEDVNIFDLVKIQKAKVLKEMTDRYSSADALLNDTFEKTEEKTFEH